MPITTNIVSSNPAHGKVYLVRHYVIKFVNDFPQVGGFLRALWFITSTNITDLHDITEILLNVALNTLNLNL